MKALLIGFLFISITTTTFAQNEIAYTDAQQENSNVLNEFQNNSTHLNFENENDISQRITKLQDLVADYDISQHSIYEAKDPSVYTIEFKEAQNKIIVQYNQEGNIIKYNKKYKNIRLPYSISLQISKSNPGWTINNNIFTSEYKNGEIVKSQYKVYLEKDNKRKIVTLN